LHFLVDFYLEIVVERSSLAHLKGRALETILRTERGVASRGGGSQPPPREAGNRPPGHYDPGARSSLAAQVRGARSRRPKSPRCERREAGVSRETQGASLGAWPAASCAGPRVSEDPYDSRRSATPSWGCAKPKLQNPGAENAPRERSGLFEIVRYDRASAALAPSSRRVLAGVPEQTALAPACKIGICRIAALSVTDATPVRMLRFP